MLARFLKHALRTVLRIGLTAIALVLAAALLLYGTGRIAERAADVAPAARPSPLPVKAAPLTLQASFETVTLYTGMVEARRRSALGFENGGTVAEILVEEGASVKEGALLARLDTRALEAERAAQVAARAALAAQAELAARTVKRQEALAKREFASEQRYDEARYRMAEIEASMARLDAVIEGVDVAISKAELRAPYAARVGARPVDDGARVAPGQPVIELYEAGALQLRVGVPGHVAGAYEAGDSAELRIAGQAYGAVLAERRGDIDRATRTVSLLFDLGGRAVPEGSLGQLSHVEAVSSGGGSGAWVPLAALSEGLRGLWTLYLIEESGEGPVVRRASVEVIEAEAGRAFVRGAFGQASHYLADGPHRVSNGQLVILEEGEV